MSKVNYISEDIEWCEKRFSEWKTYVDKNPINKLKDRKETVNGKEVITATVEVQGKFIQETMKNIIIMAESLQKLREKEAAKVTARGNQEVSPRVQALLNKNA